RVNNSLFGIGVHSRRPHVVPAAADEARPRLVVAEQPVANLHSAGSGASHLATEQLVERANGALVQFSDSPIEFRKWYAERILFGTQGHARIRIGRLLLARHHMVEARRSLVARRQRRGGDAD